MDIKINYKKIIGYFLIYFMLLWNQSNFGMYQLEENTIPILILFMILLFLKSKKLSKWCMLMTILLVTSAAFVRFTVGGIGIQAVTAMLSCIYVTAFTIVYNKKDIINRFLKTVLFLTISSIIIWAICLISPTFYTTLLPSYKTLMTYTVWYEDGTFIEYNYLCNGFFLYTFREIDYRNVGIFTEPGIYQMVINTAIFIILFMPKYVYLENIKSCLIILFIGLATTMSTTGFFGLALIIIFYLLFKRDDLIVSKNYFIILIIGLLLFISVDFIIRQTDSLFYVAIVEKIFPTGSLSFTENGSSNARVGKIILSIKNMINHPFGIGYTDFENQLKDVPFAGAELLAFGAVWGVMPLIVSLFWYFYPLKNKMKKSTLILFILLFVNTLLAQSRFFYPILMFIPLIFKYGKIVEN